MAMNIRLADGRDIDNLIKVRLDYFAEENWMLSDEMRQMLISQLRQYYTKHLNKDFFAGFIEDENKVIVSTAFLLIIEKPANLSWPTGKTGLFLNVLTYPEYRKKGYATSIMKILIEEAKKQGVSYLELSASESGKPLYKKLGFLEHKSSEYTNMRMSLI